MDEEKINAIDEESEESELDRAFERSLNEELDRDELEKEEMDD